MSIPYKDKKKMTKEQLMRELTAAESMAHAVGMERDKADKLYKEEKEYVQHLLNEIGTMLDYDREIIVNSFGPHPVRKTSLSQIARRVGQLIFIEREYRELKDRCLPIPKMQVIENDMNDRRNGGRGSGINLI